MNSDSDILYYCQTQNLHAVEKCLLSGTSPDIQSSEGVSPLQIAAANGFNEIVGLLVKSGATIDLPNSYGWTPLMHAARHGHFTTVSFLLKMKAKVNIYNKLGLTPVVAAAWSGDLQTLQLLIEAGAMLDHMPSLDQSNKCDLSTIMAAAFKGHEEILNFLIQEGVIVDQVSPATGLSPLMLAACEGYLKLVEIIIENGGDPNKTDVCGRTALDLAFANHKENTRAYLKNITVSNYDNEVSAYTDIFQAIKNGDILKVKSILKQDPEASNTFDVNDGISPLMLASMLGQINIIKLLSISGANLDAQDSENSWTPLMHAVFYRHANAVQVLLEYGSSIDIRSSNGCTALDLAQQADNPDNRIVMQLTSKLMVGDFSPKSPFPFTPTSSIDSRKLSGSERFFPKRSETQSGIKDWIGGVAQHLQTKMLTRLSPRYSEKVSTSDTLATDETIVNDVFTEQKPQNDELDDDLSVSSYSLSPNQYLAKELKEHKVEAIKPPLPDNLCPDTLNLQVKKSTCGLNANPSRNSLQVPTLLRNHTRKKAAASSRCPFKKNVFFSHSLDFDNKSAQCSQKEFFTLPSKVNDKGRLGVSRKDT